MLHLIDYFINYDLVDMPEKNDGKDIKVETLQKRPNTLTVLFSGANSPFALPLLFSMAKGSMFGCNTQLIIHIYEFTKHFIKYAKALEAELSMGGFKLLVDVIVSHNPCVSFKDIDFAILLETKSPPEEFVPVSVESFNIQQYRYLGCALNHYAKKSVKVVIVGGNVNTKALICSLFAPSIPIQNFTGLSQHLVSRITVQLAQMFKVPRKLITGVHIWGIDTADTSLTTINNIDNANVKYINEEMNVLQFFMKDNTQNKWENFQLCITEAIKLHINVLINGTEEPFSMVTASEGYNDIDPGLFVSLPVTIDKEEITIKKDLVIHPDVQTNLWLDLEKLKKDRAAVIKFVAENNHYKLIRRDFIKHVL